MTESAVLEELLVRLPNGRPRFQKPSHRRLSALILSLLAVALCGMLGEWIIALNQRASAIRIIQDSGGVIGFDYHETGREGDIPNVSTTRGQVANQIRPHTLHSWLEVPALGSPVVVHLQSVDEKIIQAVTHFADIRRLTAMSDNGVGSETWYGVEGLRRLQLLSIRVRGGQSDDELLLRLSRLPELQWLVLDGASVTSDGLQAIAMHSRLSVLSIGGEGVDDRAIYSFRQMPMLRWLILRDDTSVSTHALEQLLTERPSLVVWHGKTLMRRPRGEVPNDAP